GSVGAALAGVRQPALLSHLASVLGGMPSCRAAAVLEYPCGPVTSRIASSLNCLVYAMVDRSLAGIIQPVPAPAIRGEVQTVDVGTWVTLLRGAVVGL